MLFLKQDGSDELSGPLYDWVIFFFFHSILLRNTFTLV